MVKKNLTYRFLDTLDDYRACVRIQKEVWGFEDMLDMVPLPLLVIGRKNGGFLYGAFDQEQLIGFVYSIMGLYKGMLIHCSHMLAVLPQYRDAGVGFYLKMKQREFVLSQGINLITWTFDPFQVKNAFFNIEKLGIIIRNYYVNLYGETSSPLHYGLPTDRMLAEWYLDSEKVVQLNRKNTIPPLNYEGIPVLDILNDRISPSQFDVNALLVKMPHDFLEISSTDKRLSLELIERTRTLFTECFSNNLYVKRFL